MNFLLEFLLSKHRALRPWRRGIQIGCFWTLQEEKIGCFDPPFPALQDVTLNCLPRISSKLCHIIQLNSHTYNLTYTFFLTILWDDECRNHIYTIVCWLRDRMSPYLLFVICCIPPHFLACKLYARKVRKFAKKNCLATKPRKSIFCALAVLAGVLAVLVGVPAILVGILGVLGIGMVYL